MSKRKTLAQFQAETSAALAHIAAALQAIKADGGDAHLALWALNHTAFNMIDGLPQRERMDTYAVVDEMINKRIEKGAE